MMATIYSLKFAQSNDVIMLPISVWPSRLGLQNTPTVSLQRVRLPYRVSRYDTKQSDGEAPVMLYLWGMRSTPSFPLLPGPFWPGMVAPNRVLLWAKEKCLAFKLCILIFKLSANKWHVKFRLALEMNKCLQTARVHEWMTKGRATLIQKDSNKGTAPNNYRPITCLPMMWEILTAQIREEIYYSLTSRRLFPDEQKGCFKGSRCTAELLYINQHILDESKIRRKNLAMAWIDYKKAYDMVPHSRIINSLKIYKISDEVINFIDKTMKTWRVELTPGGRRLAEAKIQRGIFQGDALSPLLFIIGMMPLNHVLRKCTAGYKLSRSREKVDHLMNMDDIKLLAKNEKKKPWKL